MTNIITKKTKVHEYVEYCNKYKQIYGENTLCLIQMGHFYEIYAVINDDINVGETNIHSICNLLDIQITRQNKKIQEISYKNAYMAGINMIGYQKYIDLLLKHNYHVVKIDQYGTDPHIERKVSEILSPGTCIHDYNNSDINYLLSLYIEKHQFKNNEQYIVGMSIIDIKTGKNFIHNCSNPIDKNYWKDEITRCIQFYEPKELIIHTHNFDLTHEMIDNMWDTNHCLIHINLYKQHDFHKLAYLNEILKKTYQFDTMMTPIEHLNLERKLEIVKSHAYMIQYIYSHSINSLQI